jgi:hypothetical protein
MMAVVEDEVRGTGSDSGVGGLEPGTALAAEASEQKGDEHEEGGRAPETERLQGAEGSQEET